MNDYKYKIGSKIVTFNYKPKQVIETETDIFVLLEIPYSDDEINNVYCFNKLGEMNWRVDIDFDEYNIKKKLPFEMIAIIDGYLYASDFYGRRFKIDSKTGRFLGYDVIR